MPAALPDDHLIFGVLGPVVMWSATGTVRLGEPRQRAVLGALVLDLGRVVTIPRLTTLVWSDRPPTCVRKSIQVYVSQLRRLIMELPAVRLTTEREGYRLECPPQAVDLHRFRNLVERARQETAPRRRRPLLTQALALWRGDAFADANEPGLPDLIRPSLQEEHLAAVEDLYDAELRLGRQAAVVAPLSALLAEHPTRERLAGLLMVALQRCGRPADAAAVFRGLRQRLVRETGMEPGRSLLALHRTILSGEAAMPAPAATGAADRRRDLLDAIGRVSATHLGVLVDTGERYLREGDLDRALACFHAARALARDGADGRQWSRADRGITRASSLADRTRYDLVVD